MFKTTLFFAVFVTLAITIPPGRVSAAGGTMIVAQKGQPAHISASWPDGVGEIVNDPCRTKGLNSWFSEWPNDVNQYLYEVKTIEDVNRLIQKLAAVKTDLKQLRLSHLKEPRGLGWVTSLPEGNDTSVVFSIGDQSRIDQWFGHVRKPFGKMEFLAVPVAVPPTITIFVQNNVIDLDGLRIPDGIVVESGGVPAVFHRFNTTQEKEREAKAQSDSADQKKVVLDPESQAVAEKIEAFIKKRQIDKPTK
jgi:hypothetical protein